MLIQHASCALSKENNWKYHISDLKQIDPKVLDYAATRLQVWRCRVYDDDDDDYYDNDDDNGHNDDDDDDNDN